MQYCEDIAHDPGSKIPAVWRMAEYTNPRGSNGDNPAAVAVSYFNACAACAEYWMGQSWVNVKRVAPVVQEERQQGERHRALIPLRSKSDRKRDMIPLRRRELVPMGGFSFQREYVEHGLFEIITQQGDWVFRVTVNGWANAVRNLTQFAQDCGDEMAVRIGILNVCRTGYGQVGDMNLRLSPIG